MRILRTTKETLKYKRGKEKELGNHWEMEMLWNWVQHIENGRNKNDNIPLVSIGPGVL